MIEQFTERQMAEMIELMKYLRGCQNYFADEMLDCNLVTYLKPGAAA